MLKTFLTTLTLAAVDHTLRKRAPDRIPLSGMERLRGRDYYSTYLSFDEYGERLLARETNDKAVVGLWWNERDSRGYEASIPIELLTESPLIIRHYYKEIEVDYNGALEFWLAVSTLKSMRILWLKRARQWLFNKKPLARLARYTVLSYVFERGSRKRNYQTNATNMLNEMYGNAWLQHPQNREVLWHYEFVLKSLADSGDLLEMKGFYKLAPKSLLTLAKHEEEDARHKDAIRQQKVLGALTFVLAIVGTLQLLISAYSSITPN